MRVVRIRTNDTYDERAPRRVKVNESAVPNLSDRIGKVQKQSEIQDVVTIDYTIDYQNPDNFDEVTITIIAEAGGQTYKQTITGWDESFEAMNNLESAVADAYREGTQELLIDVSTAINGDPDYESEEGMPDDPAAEDRRLAARLDIDHAELKRQLTDMVGNLDTYVLGAISREIAALGFIPTSSE